jgi:hypothetical protein
MNTAARFARHHDPRRPPHPPARRHPLAREPSGPPVLAPHTPADAAPVYPRAPDVPSPRASEPSQPAPTCPGPPARLLPSARAADLHARSPRTRSTGATRPAHRTRPPSHASHAAPARLLANVALNVSAARSGTRPPEPHDRLTGLARPRPPRTPPTAMEPRARLTGPAYPCSQRTPPPPARPSPLSNPWTRATQLVHHILPPRLAVTRCTYQSPSVCDPRLPRPRGHAHDPP